jgi:hypothetical protein
MWRPNEAVEEDVSNLLGIDPQRKRRRSRRRAWRDGLADQTVVNSFEDARSYRAFERTLIGSVDPRSVIELALVHRLASLLWRLRRASAIETGLFEIQGESLLARRQESSRGPSQPAALPPTRANGHSKACGSNGRHDPPASDEEPLTASIRPPLGPWSKSRAIAHVSWAFPILTRPCLIAWAATKRDCGARRRKQFGPSRRCDSRRLQCGNDCATGSRPSPGIGKGRSRLTHSLGVERSDDEGCVRGGSLRKSVEARQVIRLSAPARSARQYDSPGRG